MDAKRVLKLLKDIEWKGKPNYNHCTFPTCPSCSSDDWAGHAPDCELAAVIQALEGV